jgi:DNA-binding NtrC family response regulator
MSTVLIIESEPWLGDHYERSLKKHDFAVVRATNAYAAMDMIDENPPTAIVMSLLLNGAGGLGLLHELQTYIDTGEIPVIVCSSLPNLKLIDLEPYGVKRLLDSSAMQPDDITAAVKSVLYKDEDDT